jgi:hypothetical protein
MLTRLTCNPRYETEITQIKRKIGQITKLNAQ